MLKLTLGFFFAAHGLIHLGYLTPAPADPNYPFRFNSWLTSVGLADQPIRALGIVLSVISIVGFVFSAAAAVGIIVPQTWWQPAIILASAASLLLLVVFWHPWLIVGVIIDIVLLIAILWLHWQPFVNGA